MELIPKDIEWIENSSERKGVLKDFETGLCMPKFIKLELGTYMSLRTRPLILRVHSSKKKEYLEGIYSEMLLYLPWCSENELKESNKEECIRIFNENEETIKKNKKGILPNSSIIDAMLEILDAPDSMRPVHLADNIDEKAQQEDMDDKQEIDETNPLDTSDLPMENEVKKGQKTPDGCPFRPLPTSTHDELIQKARSLSFHQKIVFDTIITFVKSVVSRGEQ